MNLINSSIRNIGLYTHSYRFENNIIMSWRTIIITGSAKLDLSMGFLVVRQKEVRKDSP